MDIKKIALICIAAIVIVVAAVALFGGDSTPDTTINVTDLSVKSEGYGSYKINGNLVPDKDYSYLEMVVVFYDSDGAIIEKSPLAWNINDVSAGQTIKLSGMAFVDSSVGSPVKADVYFFDSVFSGGDLDDAIYSETVNL